MVYGQADPLVDVNMARLLARFWIARLRRRQPQTLAARARALPRDAVGKACTGQLGGARLRSACLPGQDPLCLGVPLAGQVPVLHPAGAPTYSHFKSPLRLTKRWWPMIRWSTSSMSRMRPASTSRLVVSMSSGDGVGSPLGWLWQRIRPGQLRMMAGRKTSAARRTELTAVPW